MQALIVDDDELSLELLKTVIGDIGYTVATARDGKEALAIMRQTPAQLVITDWNMPEINGLDLCRAIRAGDSNGYTYIILLTAHDSPQQKLEGLYAGADSFLTKPLNPSELMVALNAAERILSLETRDLALFSLAKLAESRDSDTGAHVERVQSYSRLLAQDLSVVPKFQEQVGPEFVRLIYQTSPLHDIGKVGIPDSILLKPGKLTPAEFELMKSHTTLGAQTLDAALARFPSAKFLQVAREIAISHHEKYDGTGYPARLAGETIPLSGRIVALADVYDALTSRRVYKGAMPHFRARTIILEEKGRHFDPDIVESFLRCEKQFIAISEQLRDPEETKVTVAVAPPKVSNAAPGESILIVDDEPQQLMMLAELIKAAGYEVNAASSGEQALEIIATQRPRLVISDWYMPGIDGLSLCRAARAIPDLQHFYFVLLTIHAEKQHLIEAFAAGVDDFIAKPVAEVELLARIRAGLRSITLHDELVSKHQGSQALNAQLTSMNNRLERLAITDELTGTFNRRHAMLRLEENWAISDRYRRPLAVMVFDIDHFKQVNDTYGHAAGDAVLRDIAAILRASVRDTDTVCRIGGEEFLVICPAESAEEARVCAERCREAIGKHAFMSERAGIPAVTVSGGVAARHAEMSHFIELLNEADEALYEAKRAGRNAVKVAAKSSDVAVKAAGI